MRLIGKTIKLQPLRLTDLERVMTWVNDPEVVKNLQHFNRRITRTEEKKYLATIISSENNYLFSIFHKTTGQYVGQGGINQISWENKLGRLSLIIKKEHWNHGYAQEIIPLLLRYGFQQLKLNKLWLMVYATNQKGRHLYRKLGFRPEGTLRQEYFWQGKYHDIIRMGLLRKELKKL